MWEIFAVVIIAGVASLLGHCMKHSQEDDEWSEFSPAQAWMDFSKKICDLASDPEATREERIYFVRVLTGVDAFLNKRDQKHGTHTPFLADVACRKFCITREEAGLELLV